MKARLDYAKAAPDAYQAVVNLNRYVVRGATAVDDAHWTGTLSYKGDTFSGKMTMLDTDQMKISGCKGIFCQTLQFRRV